MQLIFAWNYSCIYHFLYLVFIFTSQPSFGVISLLLEVPSLEVILLKIFGSKLHQFVVFQGYVYFILVLEFHIEF